MKKENWNKYIADIRLAIIYVEKAVNSYKDDADIEAQWDNEITAELKAIIRDTTEVL